MIHVVTAHSRRSFTDDHVPSHRTALITALVKMMSVAATLAMAVKALVHVAVPPHCKAADIVERQMDADQPSKKRLQNRQLNKVQTKTPSNRVTDSEFDAI
jgi:hypothetical protein